jgi:hypothetical protein
MRIRQKESFEFQQMQGGHILLNTQNFLDKYFLNFKKQLYR